MSDLRRAAEMALEALENPWKAKPEGVADAIQALRQALAMERFSEVNQEIEEALAHPQSTRWEPAINHTYLPDGTLESIKVKMTPQSDWEDYIPPNGPQRLWVGLTDEEIETFKRSCHLGGVGYDTFIKRFAIGIEAKLKEKNT